MSGWLNGREGGRPIVYLDVPGARLRVWFYADKAGCELPWRAGARRDSGTFVVIGSFAGRDEAMAAAEAWYAENSAEPPRPICHPPAPADPL